MRLLRLVLRFGGGLAPCYPFRRVVAGRLQGATRRKVIMYSEHDRQEDDWVVLSAIAGILRENLDSDANAPSDVLLDIAKWVELSGRSVKPVTDQVPCIECGRPMNAYVEQLDGRCSGCGDYARDCICDQVCAVCEEGEEA